MFFWHAPIFGTGPNTPPRPASEAAIRCARIRYARRIEPARSVIAGYFIGKSIMLASALVGVTFGLSASVPPPGLGGGSSGLTLAAEWVRHGRSYWPSILIILAFVAVSIGVFPIIGRWMFDLSVHRLNSFTQHRARRARRSIRKFIVSFCVVYGLLAVAIAISSGISATFLMAASLGILLSPVAITTGLVARRGKHLTCVRCGYPMGSWRSAPECCPECGRAWREPWRHTTGARSIAWWWVSAGVVTMLACIAIQMVMLVGVFN